MSDRELKYIEPIDLHQMWAVIYEDLLVCIKQDNDHCLAEDIYHCLKMGAASLHIGLVDGEYVGFVILQQSKKFIRQPNLHVWFCTQKNGHSMTDLFQEDLEQLGRNINARLLTYTSNRKGMERLFKDFDVLETTYYKEIDYENK